MFNINLSPHIVAQVTTISLGHSLIRSEFIAVRFNNGTSVPSVAKKCPLIIGLSSSQEERDRHIEMGEPEGVLRLR
jgi:hypothetical protein